MPVMVIAAEAIPFTAEEYHTGRQINFEEFKGKVVFLDFWASWCPPCIESLPAWESMRNAIASENFELIAVNVDEESEDGIEFLEQLSINYPVIFDPTGEIGIPYGIRSLPRSFLIDKNGQIVKEYKSFTAGDELTIRREIEFYLER